MQPSAVYYCDFSTGMRESVLNKFMRLLKKAGIDQIDFENKYAAIKVHFGEMGNLSFLRHNYARQLVDYIKSRGGRPFVTDCNTLYVGQRSNALDHLDCAYQNGYNPLTLGCQVIIADGLRGLDEMLVPVNGEYVKEAKIGTAIMQADILISLNHFKGHEATGFGGAIKNLGMGCGSRAGKMEMHYTGKPSADPAICIACGKCVAACGQDAIYIDDKNLAVIDQEKCAGCGRCIGQCPIDAISPNEDNSLDILNKRMAEYTRAIVDGRPMFHISLVQDISPFCDCYGMHDVGIVPDIGMFASFDPVALDRACADAVNAQTPCEDSLLGPHAHDHADHFTALHPGTEWQVCLEHCETLGVGTQAYTLIQL